jgi:hypothetical protein
MDGIFLGLLLVFVSLSVILSRDQREVWKTFEIVLQR